MIDKTAFTSGKTMAQQYLERKAAKIEANLNETIKETGRMMIRKIKRLLVKVLIFPKVHISAKFL